MKGQRSLFDGVEVREHQTSAFQEEDLMIKVGPGDKLADGFWEPTVSGACGQRSEEAGKGRPAGVSDFRGCVTLSRSPSALRGTQGPGGYGKTSAGKPAFLWTESGLN